MRISSCRAQQGGSDGLASVSVFLWSHKLKLHLRVVFTDRCAQRAHLWRYCRNGWELNPCTEVRP